MEQVFKIALCAILVIGGLQLLQKVAAKPLPAADLDDEGFNATSTNLTVECQCNETNLTMMVDEHFLCRWRIGHHSISSLTEACAKALETFDDLQVSSTIIINNKYV